MIVLGIETSCDETGVGLVRLADDGRVELLANEVASSVDEHARFGGVVPEVASRAHLEAMVPAVRRALTTAGVRGRDVAAVAVTAGRVVTILSLTFTTRADVPATGTWSSPTGEKSWAWASTRQTTGREGSGRSTVRVKAISVSDTTW